MATSPSIYQGVTDTSPEAAQSRRRLERYTKGKVALVPKNSSYADSKSILFDIRPQITESRTTSYVNEGLPMMASGLVIYSQTESRNFSLTAKFVSRDLEEAEDNWTYIQLIKSYSIPENAMNLSSFVSERDDKAETRNNLVEALQGKKTYDGKKGGTTTNDLFSKQSSFQKFLSNYGPNILELHGYDTFNGIPVVVQSYNIDYTDDVDYIHIGNGRQVPIFQTITINLLETHISELLGDETFNIDAFRRGEQIGY